MSSRHLAANDASSSLAPLVWRNLGTALRRGYEYLVFYGLLAIFALMCLLWSLLAAILFPLLPRRIGAPLGQFVIMAGFRFFVALMNSTRIIRCDLAALDR